MKTLELISIGMYPLKFDPIFKSAIWGGERIAKYKNIHLSSSDIGESWELSDIPGNLSVVSNGLLRNATLSKLIELYQSRLMGKVSSKHFSLLIKFIDARESLSIQVHPNDEVAQLRHNSAGKTEMWYVVDAEPDSFLYAGFSKTITKEEYLERIANNTILEVLQRHEVKAGDVFFLPAGRVHAIGKGVLIAEIQQNSDVTYRIYDFERKDGNGNLRQLHNDLAVDVIDYQFRSDLKVVYAPRLNQPVLLASCPYFTTNLLQLTQPVTRNLLAEKSFVVYICLSGEALVTDSLDNSIMLTAGQTALIAAEAAEVTIFPQIGCKMLECFV